MPFCNKRKKVLEIVSNQLGNAQDNLARAQAVFGRMSQEELTKPHGESGRTRGQILDGYQAEVAEVEECIAWTKSALNTSTEPE